MESKIKLKGHTHRSLSYSVRRPEASRWASAFSSIFFFIWSCSFQERQIYKHKWCSENSNKLCSHFLFVILQPPGLVQCLIGILHRVFCCNSKHGVSSGAQFSHHQAFVHVKCYVFHINKCLLIRKCVFHINKHLVL